MLLEPDRRDRELPRELIPLVVGDIFELNLFPCKHEVQGGVLRMRRPTTIDGRLPTEWNYLVSLFCVPSLGSTCCAASEESTNSIADICRQALLKRIALTGTST